MKIHDQHSHMLKYESEGLLLCVICTFMHVFFAETAKYMRALSCAIAEWPKSPIHHILVQLFSILQLILPYC